MRLILYGISFVFIVASVLIIRSALHVSGSAISPKESESDSGSRSVTTGVSEAERISAGTHPGDLARSVRAPETKEFGLKGDHEVQPETKPPAKVGKVSSEGVSDLPPLAADSSVVALPAAAQNSDGASDTTIIPQPSREAETLLVLAGDIFRAGHVELSLEGYSRIDDIIPMIRENFGSLVFVDGHSDSYTELSDLARAAEVNGEFSLMRARAVARALENRGVSPQRIVVRGYGDTRPVASNDTSAGRAQNRRVEIKLLPSDERR